MEHSPTVKPEHVYNVLWLSLWEHYMYITVLFGYPDNITSTIIREHSLKMLLS